MYKVLKMYKGTMTRFMDLLNLETETSDKVFDDSSMVDINSDDFDFIKEDGVYDCKIELFGKFVSRKSESSVMVTVTETGIVIGNTKYLKVLIGADAYYIPQSDADGMELRKTMEYDFTRKDLVQVNDTIHASRFKSF